MKNIVAFVKKEFLEMLPPTIFFLVVFLLIVFTRGLIFENTGGDEFMYLPAIVAALIVGKSVLIADALPMWHLFDNRSRISLIVARTILYALVALVFQCLEELIPLARAEGSVAAGMNTLLAEVHWDRFWGTHIQLLVFLALYNFIAVIAEEMGRERFTRLLFGGAAAVSTDRGS